MRDNLSKLRVPGGVIDSVFLCYYCHSDKAKTQLMKSISMNVEKNVLTINGSWIKKVGTVFFDNLGANMNVESNL